MEVSELTGSRGPLSSQNATPRARTHKLIELPMEGYDGPVPEWPLLEASELELHRWETLWRTAQAAAWVRMHIDTVIARYCRLSLIVEVEMRNNVATAQTLNTVTALEKELGLSPAALKRLDWVIVANEVEEQRQVSPARPRLKAVDPDVG
jgi:hypothetical protein